VQYADPLVYNGSELWYWQDLSLTAGSGRLAELLRCLCNSLSGRLCRWKTC